MGQAVQKGGVVLASGQDDDPGPEEPRNALTLNGTSNTSNGTPDTNWGIGLWDGGTVRTTAAGGSRN